MSTPHFRKKLDFYQKTEYNKSAKSVKKRRTVSSLKKGGDTVQYVTYESMFALAQLIFSAIGAAASIITLIIAIIKLNNKRKNNRPTRQSCGYLMT